MGLLVIVRVILFLKKKLLSFYQSKRFPTFLSKLFIPHCNERACCRCGHILDGCRWLGLQSLWIGPSGIPFAFSQPFDGHGTGLKGEGATCVTWISSVWNLQCLWKNLEISVGSKLQWRSTPPRCQQGDWGSMPRQSLYVPKRPSGN